jgi:hypothetical protein
MRLLIRWTKYCRISDNYSKGFRAGFSLITLSVLCLASCTSFDYLTAPGDEFAHAKDCSECHVDVYREWSQSAHAKAFVNPHYREATGDYAFEDCMGCHAPRTGARDETPIARMTGREDGVTCVSCHLKDGKMSGPVTPTGVVKPHPIEVDEKFYRNVAICGGCHEGTLREWNSVKADKKTCQQCHMPSAVRTVTQATGGVSNIIVAFEKEQKLRRHDFPIMSDYVSGKIISVTGKRNGSILTVKVTNNLPHNLPTGSFGFRVIELRAIAFDKLNHEIVLGKRELVPELSSAIRPRGSLTWNVEIPRDAVGASIRLKRRSYEEEDDIALANVVIHF